jgi:tetratricopeptide (TPR) repeat protein
MRIRPQSTAAAALVAALCLTASAAWAAGGGAMPPGGGMSMGSAPMNPEQQAKVLFNDGAKRVEKENKENNSATTLTDPKKRDRALKDAKSDYTTALGKFVQVLKINGRMPEAWNYLGYTSRKLGNYDDALKAYSNALLLRPGYPEAIEYRGEALLAVNKVADAEQSYLDLFAANRALANKLLEAMKSWIATQRSAATADNAGTVDDLDKWVQERTQIAGQTASLTREGTAESWH